MNANAIYSKSGKGVQEASGKTSHLTRPDRAVLSAIDGRATLTEVAQKVGRAFDPAFEKLIETLDKNGFVREVSAGTAAPAAAKPGAKPAAKPGGTTPMDAVSDLDFTAAMSAPKGKAPPPPQAPPKATPPPARHTATIPPPPPPPSAAQKAQAAKSAQEQQDAFAKAREEAERKAAEERERAKAEAEAKMRGEAEAKLRAESSDIQKKLALEAEAKIKAARDAAVKAAAEAKARADAEAKKAREEAEREAKKAREEAERAKKEAEEAARREREELNRKLEQERKAREEAERKAKEEAKRLEEERRKLEEERKRREEEVKREEAERAERRKREEEEEQERRRKKREAEEEEERARAAERAERKKREEEEEARERAEKEAKRKARQEEEERERAEKEARRKAKAQEEAEEEEKPKPKKQKEKEPEPAKAAAGGGGFSDSLLADLDSFTNRDEEERKEKEEAERKAKEEAARRAREAEERRAKEDAERREREEKERRKQEEKARKASEEAELREREEKEKQRLKDEEERRKREAEEREKKAKQDEQMTAKASRGAGAYDAEAERRSRRERELAAKPKTGGTAARAERRGGLGKPIALGLLGLAAVGIGVAHVMPVDTADYERAATDALGRPVKIGSARLSLLSGLQVKFSGVTIGEDVKIAEVRGYPGFGALTGPKKDFSRIEIDGARIDQRAVGDALFVKVKADNFSVGRVVAKQIEFTGPLALPKGLEVEVNYDADGTVQSAQVRGPEALLAKLAPKGSSIEVDMSASSFTLPFAPEISLSKFSLKGTATPKGLSVSEWDGAVFNGTVTGTANVNWGDTWTVDGVITARNINAAVFAPALLSEGRGEGSGKFSMRGEPGKLASAGRLDGNFTVSRGVLGTIDLSRAIQTSGKQATGRTQFNEMNGNAVYDRGAVSLRNVTLSAGQLNAGASAEISQSGALSGRIVADVRVASQTLRATLSLGGTVKEPQVRN